MQIAAVGVGGAGGRIVDSLCGDDRRRSRISQCICKEILGYLAESPSPGRDRGDKAIDEAYKRYISDHCDS